MECMGCNKTDRQTEGQTQRGEKGGIQYRDTERQRNR